MIYDVLIFNDLNTKITYSLFNKKACATELHAILELTKDDFGLSATTQFYNISQSIERLFLLPFLKNISPIFQRWFVSDIVNQSDLIPTSTNIAVSVIEQPPLNGSKVALWIYATEIGSKTRITDNDLTVSRSGYCHHYHTQLFSNSGNAFEQTMTIFRNYMNSLSLSRCTLETNCIRTWLFINNIDNHYADVVRSRNRVFESENLLPQTHYISSTGIEGKYKYPEVIISMDAYSISGIIQDQITYLKGETHLNPTHEYGVAFERGTAVQFGDRRHVYISGTASIDNKGEIVHPLNIGLQTTRVLENINVLLTETGCGMLDIAQLIIYIRDIADYKYVENFMQTQYPDIPKIIVLAPVCRPGWLIEMECIAIKDTEDSRFAKF